VAGGASGRFGLGVTGDVDPCLTGAVLDLPIREQQELLDKTEVEGRLINFHAQLSPER